MKVKNLIAAAGVMAAVSSAGTLALAGGGHFDDAQLNAIQNAKISLVEAIRIAETQTGGRVVEAEIDDTDDDTIVYEVEVLLDDGSERELEIDINSGDVVAERDD